MTTLPHCLYLSCMCLVFGVFCDTQIMAFASATQRLDWRAVSTQWTNSMVLHDTRWSY
ncbi:hypothetical protein CY34DRAFT_807773 [Suillus luteus UH-Slu-Lm8-n1]|uniref:Uncharacterized protein n=1 Tax=Suillus luteus UH-Slu-Lm8-n1 TaxID=930992 RepID=A0A0D0APF3_9AGAM|nr:hypothetical protein CY34DRAFT_807773 [Suillus luteus UH-Slu-Lm8-n1]